MQIVALLAMEQPVTLSADDIRDEKVRVRIAWHSMVPQLALGSQLLYLWHMHYILSAQMPC